MMSMRCAVVMLLVVVVGSSCGVEQLCKSIVFENTVASHDNCDDPTNSRYYCVIVQYTGRQQ